MSHASSNFAFVGKSCSLLILLCTVHFTASLFYFILHSNSGATFLLSPRHREEKSNSTKRPIRLIGLINHTDVEQHQEEHRPFGINFPKCPDTSPLLVGPIGVEFSGPVTLEKVREENPELQKGGRWKPTDCIAQQKVAIIIPFRKREEHLKFWLYYLHPILQRQQLDYGVYVINQDGDTKFNRAKLLNVGFVEALKEYDYDCFVLSDVDIIPMDDRNIYKCYSQPRHIAVAMDKYGFRLPYNTYFGGVSALSKEQYLRINGLPNNYWGWGGEDDDIYKRIYARGMSISRPDGIIGKCRMIRHSNDVNNEANPRRFDNLARTTQAMDTNGINSLKYQMVKIERDQLFTKFTVDVGRP